MKNRTRFFGEGLFETFRVYGDKKLSFVEEHLDRMAEGCRFFSIPFSRQQAVDALKGALKEIPDDREARLRLDLVSYGKDGPEKAGFETSWDLLSQPPKKESIVVKLALAPFRRFSGSPLVRLTHYLPMSEGRLPKEALRTFSSWKMATFSPLPSKQDCFQGLRESRSSGWPNKLAFL
jgi:branched-subunit amino acid aminotransferase/4-amino-4-deoxychorismate lyase